MKIIYRDNTITNEIKLICQELNSESEQRKTLEEIIKEEKKENKNEGIGAPISEAFIDLGKYLVSFFIGTMASGITYDLVKKVILKTIPKLRSKSKNNYNHFIISNNSGPNEFDTGAYFFIPLSLSEDEFRVCLEKIEKIIKILKELQKEIQIMGSLRFYYTVEGFTLSELKMSLC